MGKNNPTPPMNITMGTMGLAIIESGSATRDNSSK
jgi:hypothetical protein